MLSIFKPKLTEEQQKLVDSVQASGLKVQIVGRGTVMVDPEDIVSSAKYQRLVDQAHLVVVEETKG
ncbi:hypothetical protein GCM10009092_38150 [Bowmanella denitrificans]|uniref:Uncharacterized protein n=1 Tax=Bowmanella denitrificans TaxID=366582 RepID=A0ABP3HGF3_9ALTE|nr:hypothetical protein [Bowmanella denitrificans]